MTDRDREPEAAGKGYHILFIGFMGAGKSTVARKLADLFSRRYVDLDRLISRRAHRSIPKIFADEGEEGFRFRETAALESMIDEIPCIISTGGGIVCRESNIALMRSLGTVVYLKVSADEAASRISDPSSRPMLSGPTSPADLLSQRVPLYERAADCTIDTAGKSIDEVVMETGEMLWKGGLL